MADRVADNFLFCETVIERSHGAKEAFLLDERKQDNA